MIRNFVKFALEEVDIHFSHPYVYHKMVSELNNSTSGKVTFSDFCKLVSAKKHTIDESTHDVQDAFVAMGGGEDGRGNIDADKLIGIIKEDLKMTINIEDMIKEVDEDDSGEIEFDEFKTQLQTDGDNPEIRTFKDWFCYK